MLIQGLGSIRRNEYSGFEAQGMGEAYLSGKTPNLSRPATLRPPTTRDLAESPSVRISVHSSECLPPASLASISLVTPADWLQLVNWVSA